MPGSCQRIRLPSLTSVLKSTRANSADYPSSSSSTNGTKRCNTSTHSSNLMRKQQHRIVVMGAAKVGKTCIISQFLYDKFNPRYKQTVEELHRGEYDLPDGSALTLDILDTSGSYEFPAMRTLSISSGAAFVLVYDVNDRESWYEVERLRNLIITQKGTQPPIVVVGNKTDVNESERQVEYEVTEMVVCEDWQCGYIECSAKENIGIVQIFKELLVQANIRYNLSPAVRRRRQSLPSFTSAKGSKSPSHRGTFKRHSCTMT
ncbi:ras-related protein Rap-2b-like [Haematobia irritans]|uniref:ras-related protein Rap-2b-like n=1 Tax=Haematobia irritans TaxID=7368 RepID=UPI003F4FC62A